MMSWFAIAGAFLFVFIISAMTTHWQAIIALPASAAAFLGALAGAGGGLLAIILGALVNAELNRRRDDRLRREEGRALALSLHGEVLSIANVFERQQEILACTIEDLNNSGIGVEYFKIPARMACSCLIFSHCCDRLGLLENSDLIADLAQFYASIPKSDEFEEVPIRRVQAFCNGRLNVAATGIKRAVSIANRLEKVAELLAPRL